jgi:hypothetical protein
LGFSFDQADSFSFLECGLAFWQRRKRAGKLDFASHLVDFWREKIFFEAEDECRKIQFILSI